MRIGRGFYTYWFEVSLQITAPCAPFPFPLHRLHWEVKNMSLFSCNCKCRCPLAALIVSVILGVVTAFLQITGVVTAAPVFLWVVFGISIVYLGVLVIAAALARGAEAGACLCTALNALLIGILGTILFAVVLLAVGIVATSILSAILVGILLFFFTLTVTSTACLVRDLLHCGSCAQ